METGAVAPNRPTRLEHALEVLVRVPTGRAVIQRAMRRWHYSEPSGLLEVLRWGSSSRTDAVLTRHFNPKTGEERRDRQITVYLRQDQPLEDLVLDITHELVHATARPSWDPYDPKLTAGRYIWSAIEGEGGEVEAVMAECQVGLELAHHFGTSAERCARYVKDGSAQFVVERERVRRDFYRVGKWGHELNARLGAEKALFPLLSEESPKLYSSTGHAPYPVALLKEFEEITQIACENSIKRVGSRSAASAARSPASSSPASASGTGAETAAFLTSRCGR